jgi:hypothetical protein
MCVVGRQGGEVDGQQLGVFSQTPHTKDPSNEHASSREKGDPLIPWVLAVPIRARAGPRLGHPMWYG